MISKQTLQMILNAYEQNQKTREISVAVHRNATLNLLGLAEGVNLLPGILKLPEGSERDGLLDELSESFKKLIETIQQTQNLLRKMESGDETSEAHIVHLRSLVDAIGEPPPENPPTIIGE